jgi:hypothetical protein
LDCLRGGRLRVAADSSSVSEFSPRRQLAHGDSPGGIWAKYTTMWSSGTNTMATIEIVDTNLVAATNDVVIADMFFGVCN